MFWFADQNIYPDCCGGEHGGSEHPNTVKNKIIIIITIITNIASPQEKSTKHRHRGILFGLMALAFTLDIILLYLNNRPFARSGHIVQNKLHWDANYAVGLSKQWKVGLDWCEFLCFGSPTA